MNELRPAPVTPACEPLAPQEIVNQLAAVVTASLKLTVMFALVVTLVAPFAGDVEVTEGAEFRRRNVLRSRCYAAPAPPR